MTHKSHLHIKYMIKMSLHRKYFLFTVDTHHKCFWRSFHGVILY